MLQAPESVNGKYDWFHGGHVFIKRNTIRGIFDYQDKIESELIMLKLLLFKYTTMFKGDHKVSDAEFMWERSGRTLKKIDWNKVQEVFDFVATKAGERDYSEKGGDARWVCRLPRAVGYNLTCKGSSRAEILILLISCLQMGKRNLCTFRISPAVLGGRFGVGHSSFSKAIKRLKEKELLIPLQGRPEDVEKLGELYTWSCNKLWFRAYVPMTGFEWNHRQTGSFASFQKLDKPKYEYYPRLAGYVEPEGYE